MKSYFFAFMACFFSLSLNAQNYLNIESLRDLPTATVVSTESSSNYLLYTTEGCDCFVREVVVDSVKSEKELKQKLKDELMRALNDLVTEKYWVTSRPDTLNLDSVGNFGNAFVMGDRLFTAKHVIDDGKVQHHNMVRMDSVDIAHGETSLKGFPWSGANPDSSFIGTIQGWNSDTNYVKFSPVEITGKLHVLDSNDVDYFIPSLAELIDMFQKDFKDNPATWEGIEIAYGVKTKKEALPVFVRELRQEMLDDVVGYIDNYIMKVPAGLNAFGLSGSPLLQNGQVVGLVTTLFEGNESFNFLVIERI